MGASSGRERIVVVGDGMVGHRFCQNLAAAGAAGRCEVMVFAEEPRPAYDRVNLGQVLRGRAAETLNLASSRWYTDQGFALHLGDPVVQIDLEARRIRARAGAVVEFDRLVLATGAAPVIPRIRVDGAEPGALHPLHTLDDVERLRARLPGAERAVVLGGGLLGTETAVTLASLGMAVELVEASRHLLSGRLDAVADEMLRQRLERLGVEVRLGETVHTVTTSADGKHRLALSGGAWLPADLIVLATGVRPCDGLARAAGLQLGPRGGVVVDHLSQSSHPRVYAIGDCAQVARVPMGHVGPGYRMADALAATVLGRPTAFEPTTDPVYLKVSELDVFVIGGEGSPGADGGGAAGDAAEGIAEGAAGNSTREAAKKSRPRAPRHRASRSLVTLAGPGYRKIVISHGRMVGAQAVGPWAEAQEITRAVVEHRRVGLVARRRFLRCGEIWPQAAAVPASARPASEIACNCGGVTFGALRTAVDDGCRSLIDVRQRTGAGCGCGSCAPLITDLIRAESLRRPARALAAGPSAGPSAVPSAPRAPLATSGTYAGSSARGLAWLGALAAVTTVLAAAAGWALPIPRGLTTNRWPSALWIEPRLQNLTGYAMLSGFVLALALPLVKRLARKPGHQTTGQKTSRLRRKLLNVKTARLLHAAIGLAVILAGVAHTGGRLGANLNAALAVMVALLLGVGGAVAMAMARAAHATPAHKNGAAKTTRWLRVLHMALVWPALALLAIHLYAVLKF
jgi:nitrite reductase (NADH) large subunit